MSKKCTICNIEKELIEFYKKSNNKDGYRSDCKSCSKEYNQKIKEKRSQYNKEYRIKNHKTLKDKKKIYYQENIEYFKHKNKEMREKIDPKKKAEYSKKYENKDSTRKKRRERSKERMDTDPLFKLKSYIRKRIWYSLKNEGYSKKEKTEGILGCSIEEFKKYIEDKFQDYMSWENQGKWHLDHIKPTSLAKNETEMLELNHYSNFQPLWSHDNLSKGNRWEN